MAALHHRIRNDVAKQCSTVVDCALHTYCSVLLLLTTDVIKAVKHLRNNKYNDDGVLMSNNFQNVTQLLYSSVAQLFPVMLNYHQYFLRFTMITHPKRMEVKLLKFRQFRSIANGSVLRKILDYNRIDPPITVLLHYFNYKELSIWL